MMEPIKTYRLGGGYRLLLQAVAPVFFAALIAKTVTAGDWAVALPLDIVLLPVFVSLVCWGRNKVSVYSDRVVVTRAFKTQVLLLENIAKIEGASPTTWRRLRFEMSDGQRVFSRAISGYQSWYPDPAFDAKIAEICARACTGLNISGRVAGTSAGPATTDYLYGANGPVSADPVTDAGGSAVSYYGEDALGWSSRLQTRRGLCPTPTPTTLSGLPWRIRARPPSLSAISATRRTRQPASMTSMLVSTIRR